jgi:hypothetical protein
MPMIRSVVMLVDRVVIVDHRGVTITLLYSGLPPNQNTIEKAETWFNNHLANVADNYQARVHVFSRNPIRLTILMADIDEIIDLNWWI